MLVTVLIIIAVIIALLFIVSIIAGTGLAVGQIKQMGEFKKELATMTPTDLELLLDDVRGKLKHTEVSDRNLNPGLELDLADLRQKEMEIILALRGRWEDGLSELTVEQLEEEDARLAATPKLLNEEDHMRRKLLQKVIRQRRSSSPAGVPSSPPSTRR